LKLTNTGFIQWKKVLGGFVNEGPRSILQTPDDGYLFVGYTSSNDSDVSGNHGGDFDGWVVKLSSSGAIQWQKALGGSGRDEIWSAQLTTDNGFILAGRSSSVDGDATSNNGQIDFWVVKLDESGEIQWQKSFGGSENDLATSVKPTSDGGYIIVGETASNDGDVTNLHGNIDFWVIKLSSLGALEWQKTLGGNNWDTASDVIQISDGGYVVVGYVGSAPGDITVYHGLFDWWVVKLSSSGELLWQKSLGGSEPDYARSIVPAPTGGYIVAGGTQSSDWDALGNNGGAQFWLAKISEEGALVWQKTYGGSMAEQCYSIGNTADNGFILTGYTWSNDGDAAGTVLNGKAELWVVKLSPGPTTPTTSPYPTSNLEIFPNPATESIFIKIPTQATTINVRIFDVLGREMLHQKISNGGQMDIARLEKGVYFVAADAGGLTVFWGKVEKP